MIAAPDGRRLLVVMIAAVARNAVIGHNGDLPWRLPRDLARFQRVTRGHAVVMGRKTLETLPGPLKERVNIVLTRDRGFSVDGVIVCHELGAALSAAAAHTLPEHDRVFIAGGGEVYRAAMGAADVLDITEVAAEPEGSVRFPDVDPSIWRLVSRDEHPADERHSAGFAFVEYRRR